jgi:hypothetical protein
MLTRIEDLIRQGIFDIPLDTNDPTSGIGVYAGNGAFGYAPNGTRWVKVGSSNNDWKQFLFVSDVTSGNTTFNTISATTIHTTTIHAVSSFVDVIDIKQYELSGFDVEGNVTIDGNINVTGTVDGRDIASDGSKIDTLILDVSYLSANIDSNFNLQTATDNYLSGAIDSNFNLQTATDNYLSANIDSNFNLQTATDNYLSANIDSNFNLQTATDNYLSGAIDNTDADITFLSGAIDYNFNLQTATDNYLSANIDSNFNLQTATDNYLSGAIDSNNTSITNLNSTVSSNSADWSDKRIINTVNSAVATPLSGLSENEAAVRNIDNIIIMDINIGNTVRSIIVGTTTSTEDIVTFNNEQVFFNGEFVII